MRIKTAKGIAWLGLLAMTAGLANGFINGDFFKDGQMLLQNPWGIMSIIDLYVGFILFSLWIAHREKNRVIALLWILMMMILGFFTGSLYVLMALYQSGGDWQVVFHGKN